MKKPKLYKMGHIDMTFRFDENAIGALKEKLAKAYAAYVQANFEYNQALSGATDGGIISSWTWMKNKKSAKGK